VAVDRDDRATVHGIHRCDGRCTLWVRAQPFVCGVTHIVQFFFYVTILRTESATTVNNHDLRGYQLGHQL